VVLLSAFAAHIVVAYVFAADLIASRVPDYPSIERVAHLLPAGARVALIYLHYGASPAVWLDRNVEKLKDLDEDLRYLQSMNFHYLLILDVKSRYSSATARTPLSKMTANLTPQIAPSQFADPSSAERRYCDSHFRRLFDSRYAVLYSMGD
jgi:hypothetical protein